jgi:hypothetical protein
MFKVQRRFTIETIRITNPDKWKVAKLPEFLNQDEVSSRNPTVISDGGFKNSNLHKVVEEEEDLIINEDIKVIEFAPDIFTFLRRIDNVDHESILKSLHPDFNRESVFRAGESQGKSGSFFFFSHDKNFIIKTMTDSDMKTFMNMFEQYFAHVSQN